MVISPVQLFCMTRIFSEGWVWEASLSIRHMDTFWVEFRAGNVEARDLAGSTEVLHLFQHPADYEDMPTGFVHHYI